MSASSIGQASVPSKNITSLLKALSKPNDGDADDANSKPSVPAKAALPPGVGHVVDKLA